MICAEQCQSPRAKKLCVSEITSVSGENASHFPYAEELEMLMDGKEFSELNVVLNSLAYKMLNKIGRAWELQTSTIYSLSLILEASAY